MAESPLETVERLAYVDGQRRDATKKQIREHHYAQYTHRPQIDAISSRPVT